MISLWFLSLMFSLELGYAPYYGSLNSLPVENVYIRDESVYYISMDADVIVFDNFFIGGAIKTYIQDKTDNYTYFPFESDYMFKAGFRYENLELGFRHLCLHPVRPLEIYYQPQGSTDASYEEFYIKITGRF